MNVVLWVLGVWFALSFGIFGLWIAAVELARWSYRGDR